MKGYAALALMTTIVLKGGPTRRRAGLAPADDDRPRTAHSYLTAPLSIIRTQPAASLVDASGITKPIL